MPASDQETFLIVQGHISNLCRAFLFQGTYDQVHHLEHEHFQLNIFLLAAEPDSQPTRFGTQLAEVSKLYPVASATSHVTLAALALRHLPREQRLRELERARATLDAEYREVRALTEDEIDKISRF